MNILGIETSCDETSAAIVSADEHGAGIILSNLVFSQLEEHAVFGGVVPEVAARAHMETLDTLIKGALQEADLGFADLDGIAATAGPGLIGGVMVGLMTGKAIAAAHDLPFMAVNHLEGHALTPRLTDDLQFPYLLLLVSGGHTQILVAEGVGQYKRWGTTLDDAAGECFDKSAKLMGLPYPGGPHLQDIASECTDIPAAQKRFALPLPMKGRAGCDFSFSGLKTAVRNHVQSLPAGDLQRKDIADLAASMQSAMAAITRDRTANAMQQFIRDYPGAKRSFVVSGGVAANTAIRAALTDLCATHDFTFHAPPIHLCGDNAAMIGWAGLERLKLGLTDAMDAPARPRWPLDENAPKRHGAGVKA